jgi:hypothetical protein
VESQRPPDYLQGWAVRHQQKVGNAAKLSRAEDLAPGVFASLRKLLKDHLEIYHKFGGDRELVYRTTTSDKFMIARSVLPSIYLSGHLVRNVIEWSRKFSTPEGEEEVEGRYQILIDDTGTPKILSNAVPFNSLDDACGALLGPVFDYIDACS